jgi:hypothetical protein
MDCLVDCCLFSVDIISQKSLMVNDKDNEYSLLLLKTKSRFMDDHMNEPLQLANEFVRNTGRNVFLSGKAGTGKTTFLHRVREDCGKRMVVVAPTGVTAINAGGVTIHSFFQLGFGPLVPTSLTYKAEFKGSTNADGTGGIKKFSREKIRLIRSLDLLVIDEVSMVRADMLDAIDEVLRRFRNPAKPFGGVQVLIIGDLFQLSPVVKEDEWELLKPYYTSAYFFSSRVFAKAEFIPVELQHIYRQDDRHFIDLLNAVRTNSASEAVIEELNQRFQPAFDPADEDGYITLTTHNYMAAGINSRKLEMLTTPLYKYTAQISGDFPAYAFPGDEELLLKTGAQVMFIKNDLENERRFYNGKIGRVIETTEESIRVQCPGDETPIEVGKMSWKNIRYSLNEETREVNEEEIGTFTQFPLKLAWAITIHKSQGLTFDKAVIDAQAAFAFGQVYVALSRCRTLQGLVLKTKISQQNILSDAHIIQYTKEAVLKNPDALTLSESQKAYQCSLLLELFSYESLARRFASLRLLMDSNPTEQYSQSHQQVLDAERTFTEEILKVSSRFQSELHKHFITGMLPESNPALQERVQKAAAYFYQKTRSVLGDVLDKLQVLSENKEFRKTFTALMEQLQKMVSIKVYCLQQAEQGFTVRNYLNARVKAELDFDAAPSRPARTKGGAASLSKHPALYRILNEWRENRSREEEVRPIQILTQKGILLLSDYLPVTIKELKMIRGIGAKKIAAWGEEIVKMICDYCSENNIEREDEVEFRKLVKGDKLQNSTYFKTLELFNSGKSIPEIASARGLATSTIEGHLSRFIADGDVDLSKIIDLHRLQRAEEFILRSGNFSTILPAKEFFGDEFSFGELRMILAHVQRKIHEKTNERAVTKGFSNAGSK